MWDELRQKVGTGGTASALIMDLTDEDAFETVRPLLIRHIAAHLDQGLTPWHNPAQRQGFYAAWRQSMQDDLACRSTISPPHGRRLPACRTMRSIR